MCKRFRLAHEEARRFAADCGFDLPEGLPEEILTGGLAAGLALAPTGRIDAQVLRFGFPLAIGKTVVNARIETAGQKPMFAEDFATGRILVPASGFWENDSHGFAHQFVSSRGGILLLAGIRDRHGRFVLLTATPASELRKVHNRMPLCIEPGRIKDYLAGPAVVKRLLALRQDALTEYGSGTQVTLF